MQAKLKSVKNYAETKPLSEFGIRSNKLRLSCSTFVAKK